MMKHEPERILFTKEMKKDYTILLPSMLNIHFSMIQDIFSSEGYHVEILSNQGPSVATEGLKYVHNDICYPALLVIGQMIEALNSGKYDVHKTALMITQTGGGCRASNYIHLLRKALVTAGYPQVPVVSLNLSGFEKNSGFSLTISLLRKAFAAMAYGDLMMLLDNQIKPYERTKGDSAALVKQYSGEICAQFRQGKGYSKRDLKKNLSHIAAGFAEIPILHTPKIKVGIVGEIYVKYASLGNNNLEEFLASQNCEVMVPGIFGFVLFKIDNRLEDLKLYGGNKLKKLVATPLYNYVTKVERLIIDAASQSGKFIPPTPYAHLKELIKGVVGYGNKMGEGWLLTAEMLELIEHGFENIVCAQPFGCLPNHIVGKGMIRKLKQLHPQANIVPIDYDPSATKVNQENRIKLMLAVAADIKNGVSLENDVTVNLEELFRREEPSCACV